MKQLEDAVRVAITTSAVQSKQYSLIVKSNVVLEVRGWLVLANSAEYMCENEMQ